MKCIFVLASLCLAGLGNGQQYVWNLLKPPLTAEEVQAILISKSDQFPTYNEVPDTDFNCASKQQGGFYADVQTGCQAFHRCDLNGNMTSYLCVNTTVFNQITLVCDFWFNVDCQRSVEFENFANSRLYTNQVLFDTPPADWVMPGTQSFNNPSSSENQQGSSASAPGAVVVKVQLPAARATTKKAAATSKKPAPAQAKPVPAPNNAASAQPDQTASASADDAGVQAGGEATAADNSGAAEGSAAASSGPQGRLTITVLGNNQQPQQAPNP